MTAMTMMLVQKHAVTVDERGDVVYLTWNIEYSDVGRGTQADGDAWQSARA